MEKSGETARPPARARRSKGLLRRASALAAAVLALACVPPAFADLDDIRFRLSADIAYDDNVSRAREDDRLDDSFATRWSTPCGVDQRVAQRFLLEPEGAGLAQKEGAGPDDERHLGIPFRPDGVGGADARLQRRRRAVHADLPAKAVDGKAGRKLGRALAEHLGERPTDGQSGKRAHREQLDEQKPTRIVAITEQVHETSPKALLDGQALLSFQGLLAGRQCNPACDAIHTAAQDARPVIGRARLIPHRV
jgi:hypothetical protein